MDKAQKLVICVSKWSESRRRGCVQQWRNQLGTRCLHGLELHPRWWLHWLASELEWRSMLVQRLQWREPGRFGWLHCYQWDAMWTYHTARNLLPRRSIMFLLLCGCHHDHHFNWEWRGFQHDYDDDYDDYDEDQNDLPSQSPQSPQQARAPQKPPPEPSEPSSTCTTVPLQLRCPIGAVRCQVSLMRGKDPLRAGGWHIRYINWNFSRWHCTVPPIWIAAVIK